MNIKKNALCCSIKSQSTKDATVNIPSQYMYTLIHSTDMKDSKPRPVTPPQTYSSFYRQLSRLPSYHKPYIARRNRKKKLAVARGCAIV